MAGVNQVQGHQVALRRLCVGKSSCLTLPGFTAIVPEGKLTRNRSKRENVTLAEGGGFFCLKVRGQVGWLFPGELLTGRGAVPWVKKSCTASGERCQEGEGVNLTSDALVSKYDP